MLVVPLDEDDKYVFITPRDRIRSTMYICACLWKETTHTVENNSSFVLKTNLFSLWFKYI